MEKVWWEIIARITLFFNFIELTNACVTHLWKAFLKAWSDACKWNGSATVLIPEGTYMLKSVIFKGPCNGSVTFQIKGVLKAPIDPSLLTDKKWINFRYIDQLNVNGGGRHTGWSRICHSPKMQKQCELWNSFYGIFLVFPFFFLINQFIKGLHSLTGIIYIGSFIHIIIVLEFWALVFSNSWIKLFISIN